MGKALSVIVLVAAAAVLVGRYSMSWYREVPAHTADRPRSAAQPKASDAPAATRPHMLRQPSPASQPSAIALPGDLPPPARTPERRWYEHSPSREYSEPAEVTAALADMRGNYARFRKVAGRIRRTDQRMGIQLTADSRFVADSTGTANIVGTFRVVTAAGATALEGTESVSSTGPLCRTEITFADGRTQSASLPESVCPFFTHTSLLHETQWSYAGQKQVELADGATVRTIDTHVLQSTNGLKTCYIDSSTGQLVREELRYGMRNSVATTCDYLEYQTVAADNRSISFPSRMRIVDSEKTSIVSLSDITFDQQISESAMLSSGRSGNR